MDTGREELDRMRRLPAAWPELRHEAATDEDGDDYDRNAAKRAQVLWALQYDRRPGDLPLVRWLAEQEVFQGLTEETKLAGYLLAEFRQVDDVWLQWEIKGVDYDTWCGYDVEFLFAAGIQETIDFVRASAHPERDAVLGHLLDEEGQPIVSEQELADWFEHRRSYFPADPADEDEITWLDRARLLDDQALARHWLDRWADGRPRDRDTLTLLRHRLAEFGSYAEAAAAQRELLAFTRTAWESAAGWRSLAGLERRAGDLDASWAALRECRRVLDDVSGWTGAGLGHSYVEELFRLAADADGELARVVFTEAEHQSRAVSGLPPATLEAAAEAAGKAGDPARAAHYRALGQARIG
ncbi:hypothetical protein KZ829_38180 [Actinoplanes hulinensis]|uniref:DUF4240 domain-containing protein n=1 Tax=Actinoplanes hulinensis TaxID=1144547 RepID=A0ABS7BFA4_9ACTN|nr:hypothetical protein [Actinoplanes hulinensis]